VSISGSLVARGIMLLMSSGCVGFMEVGRGNVWLSLVVVCCCCG
jgi:hypothetical protein